MLSDELIYRVQQAFGFMPTADQRRAMDVFARFMTDRNDHSLMILRGSAGTGKTSVASAMVKALKALGQKFVLLAPTGRAAKVFSINSGTPAYTVHRRIYRQRSAGDLSGFSLNDNLCADTLFMVDEASMLANQGYGDAAFGSGCLLDDLVQFVYNGRNCRMMLIGDKAQLPPVGEEESPALVGDYMRGYGLSVYECELNEVLRQSSESGILWNATKIRQMISNDDVMQLPRVCFYGFTDIRTVSGDELIEQLASSHSHVGIDETMVVTRSNKRANIYNKGIRAMVLGREEELCSGDMLMIVKNNYYWMEQESARDSSAPSFLANGDRCVVRRVRNIREMYGFRFADLVVQFPDYDDYEITATALLDSLNSESPSLTREQTEQLYNAVMEDYADIPLKADRMKALRKDPYYNALQIKYAYAVTCHKAQGGQWAHIYVDQGYMTDDMLTPEYMHWLYTAFTRATEQLYLVNWPKEQIEVKSEIL